MDPTHFEKRFLKRIRDLGEASYTADHSPFRTSKAILHSLSFRSKFIRESIFRCFLRDHVFLHLAKSGSMHTSSCSCIQDIGQLPQGLPLSLFFFSMRDREYKGRGMGDGYRYGGNRTIPASDFFGNMYPVRLLK